MQLEPDRMLSHYRLVEKIGQGGMGVVWKAEDTKLGRAVALKVLPPDRVGDEERRLRFLREARTAAAISHPHIAAVHEIDEADGVIFIAMELVQGETLRSLLESGVPPLRKTLRMATEMAEALGSAHEANIVHRDLKPDNVMVRPDGHVKILDFGLAKLREDRSDSPDTTRMQTLSAEMTREGKILGTAAYMSPEQARAQSVDFRSDLFSFGIVLYEMATGRSPFHGPSVTDTLSSIVRDQPPPMAQIAPGVPEELARITSKCLEKDPDERYQHTDDLAMDLRKLRRVTDSQTMSRVSDTAMPAASGRPAWLRPVPVLLAVLVVAAIAMGLPRLWRTGALSPGGGRAGNALAVLTFENLQDSDDTQRLGQILQELIITDLSELESLTVFSSQRLFDVQKQIGGAGGGRGIDRTMATQVAIKAGATTMLTGSLSQLGNNWILTGQLVDVSSGRVLKSERIDGADLYKMVDDLTAKIREDLRLSQEELAGVDRAVNERTTSSLEAYQHYLEGTELLARWEFDDAVEEFQQAIAIDPRFGQARFKHAIAAWWALGGGIPDSEETSPSELLRELLDGDFKLSAKDRLLAKGMLAVVEDRHKDAQRELSKLVQEYPDEKEAWYGLGEAHYHQSGGDRQAGFDAFEKALDLDPTFHLAYRHLRDMYREQKRYREGIDKLRGLMAHDPDNPGYYQEWIRLLLLDGDAAGAEDVLETALGRITEPDRTRDFLIKISRVYRFLDDEERRSQLLQDALVLDTEDATDTVLAELGWHFFEINDRHQSEDHFLQALELNPKGTSALAGIFRVYRSERRFSDGILRARGLIQKDREHLPFYYEWIAMAAQRGDEDETDRAIQAALQHASTPVAKKKLWAEVADAYRDVGNETRATELLRKSLDVDPEGETWQTFLTLGWNSFSLGDYAQAEEWLRKATEQDTGAENRAFTGLVRSNLELGRYDAALQHATKHAEVHVQESLAQAQVVTTYLVSEQASKAEEALATGLAVLDLDSRKRGLLGSVARTYLNIGQPARAEELARRAVDLDPDVRDPWLRATLSATLRRQERYDEAEAVIRQGLDVVFRELSLHREFALLDLLRGDLATAENRVRNLLSDGPAQEGLFHMLAHILAERERFTDARQYARRAFSMNPSRSNHTLLAWILIAGELDLEEGMRLARAALERPASWSESNTRYPFMPSPEHALGLAHLKQGRQGKAVEMLEKAATLRPDRTLIQEHLAQARR
jgi:tetratricopeptide (TPR) repeat protein/predicted Ser/Thr protein kinase